MLEKAPGDRPRREVCGCPGPGLPTTCPQIQGRSCPLTRGVDLVVLDPELHGDFGDGSPPSWVLLDSYLERLLATVRRALAQ